MVLSTIFMILIIQSTPLANSVQDLIEQIIINIIIVYGQHAFCLHKCIICLLSYYMRLMCGMLCCIYINVDLQID